MGTFIIEYVSVTPSTIFVVDDDPIAGGLTVELLQDAGYQTKLLLDSQRALESIREEKPALVVLDILMPGMDGLTLLHRLKSDPKTQGIKVVIASGKAFAAEKKRALQYGAEAFIEKPYEIATFAQEITKILDAAGIAPAPNISSGKKPILPAVKATIWGCRSATRVSSITTSRYGKRTSCLSLEIGPQFIIFDAGSGLERLGEHLVSENSHKDLWMFLTHFHDDHVEGLAKFSPAKDASYTLHISGAADPERSLEEMVEQTLRPAFGDEMPPAKIELYELQEQTYEIMPGMRLSTFYANHPGRTLGFVLTAEGHKIVYCPDSEFYGDAATALQDYDEKIGALCRNADVMFHDGRYTPEDYARHRNSGHSSFLAAVDFAGRNHVKKLVLVHQDDEYNDDVLDRMERDAAVHAQANRYDLTVLIGREGLNLTL